MIDGDKVTEMIKQATVMLDQAYVPYSHFPVGAAILTREGKIFAGCNIENASYGLSNCAERTAIFKAISSGYRQFDYLVVIGQTDQPITPCGACRQVISEFCQPDMPVLMVNSKGDWVSQTIGQLLPDNFKPGDMEYGKQWKQGKQR